MVKVNSTDIYLVDSATMHTILKSKIYFTHLGFKEASTKMIEGFGRATILFLKEYF